MKILVRKLSKKCHFRKRFDSQDLKLSQILAKSPSENFYHLFSSFGAKLIQKISPLEVGGIIGVFVGTLNADGKYPAQYCENLRLRIQMQFSQFSITFTEST